MVRVPGEIKDFPDDRLRYLLESVRLRTMRAASDYLGMAPSSVSRQIAGLEKDLGIDLVEKNRHTVQLTAAGVLVLDYYRDRLAQREALLAALADAKGTRQGHVRIAVGTGLIRVALAATVGAFALRYPGISLSVREVASRDILPIVRDDDAHFGVVLDPPYDPRITARSSFAQPLCFIAAPTHPLAARASLAMGDLVGHPLVLPHEGFRVRQILTEAEIRQNLVLDARITTTSIQFIADVVMAGVGATIIPTACVSDHVAAGRLVAIPFTEADLAASRVHLVTRVGRKLPGSALSLLDMLDRSLRSAG